MSQAYSGINECNRRVIIAIMSADRLPVDAMAAKIGVDPTALSCYLNGVDLTNIKPVVARYLSVPINLWIPAAVVIKPPRKRKPPGKSTSRSGFAYTEKRSND